MSLSPSWSGARERIKEKQADGGQNPKNIPQGQTMKRTPLKRHTPLKRSAPPKRTRLKRSKPPTLPQWVLDWWCWVSSQPCVICSRQAMDGAWADWMTAEEALTIFKQRIQRSDTEVAHVGPRGLRQKCDPREVLPLCGVLHHRLGAYSAHRRGKEFWKFHGLIRKQVVRELQERYQRETGVDLASFGKRLRPDFTAFDQEGHR